MLRRIDSLDERTLLAEFRTAAQPYAHTTQIRDFDTTIADLFRSTAAWPAGGMTQLNT